MRKLLYSLYVIWLFSSVCLITMNSLCAIPRLVIGQMRLSSSSSAGEINFINFENRFCQHCENLFKSSMDAIFIRYVYNLFVLHCNMQADRYARSQNWSFVSGHPRNQNHLKGIIHQQIYLAANHMFWLEMGWGSERPKMPQKLTWGVGRSKIRPDTSRGSAAGY